MSISGFEIKNSIDTTNVVAKHKNKEKENGNGDWNGKNCEIGNVKECNIKTKYSQTPQYRKPYWAEHMPQITYEMLSVCWNFHANSHQNQWNIYNSWFIEHHTAENCREILCGLTVLVTQLHTMSDNGNFANKFKKAARERASGERENQETNRVSTKSN